ncbi:hypothetical protein CERSUDRAFT_120731 [Gelatoporia subvermispora B]|uniref:Uncharacterized protein n=1 Tax=Ceriporiopsis subvermispora (strain B) TaxID=914234 RepID=M2QXD2_CERS8|nr:hypothetical protein CERSUDRAFT_120731 [Gelatoporia subvermispora B]
MTGTECVGMNGRIGVFGARSQGGLEEPEKAMIGWSRGKNETGTMSQARAGRAHLAGRRITYRASQKPPSFSASSTSHHVDPSTASGSRDLHSKKGRSPKDYDALLSPKSVTSLLTTGSSALAFSTASHSDGSNLASPEHMHHCDLPVPPTTNELSPIDKTRLMRKVRKLSRVLGELPVPSATDDAATDLYLSDITEGPPSASTISTFSPISPSSVHTSTKSLRRSATFGHGASLNVSASEVQRARSFVSLRPALTINLSQLTPSSHSTKLSPIYTPTSPIVFASSGDLDNPHTGLSRTPSIVCPDIEAKAMQDEPPNMFPVPPVGLCARSFSQRKRHDSTASSILVPETPPEQLQRARAAKLTRQLGNGVPPDVLLRAVAPASRPGQRPSTSAGVANGKLLDQERLPQRSSSLRRGPVQTRRQARKRLSLDLRALAGMSSHMAPPANPEVHSPGPEDSAKSGKSVLKKSKSGWLSKSSVRQESSQDELRSTFSLQEEELAQGKEPMSEKQRVAAVKRARKMAQMFGDKPPIALIHITNVPSSEDTSAGMLMVPDSRRSSRTTIASISSVGTMNRHLRESFVSAISEPASPIVSTDPAFSEATKASEHDTLSADSVVDDICSLSLASTSSRGAQSTTSNTLLLPHQQAFSSQPRTPPPFSTMFVFPPEPEVPPPAPEHTSSPREFRARRRQATKLSQFFGVDLHDIAGALPAGIDTTPPTPLPLSRATSPHRGADPPRVLSRNRSAGPSSVTRSHQRMQSQGHQQELAAHPRPPRAQ